MQMKTLSIKQPYAAAILCGLKVEEYRARPTHHRGLLAVHAPLTLMLGGFDDYPNFNPARVITGAVLGTVEVVDCQEEVYGGSFAWILTNPRWLARPLPLKGKLNVFTAEIPDELLPADVLAAAKAAGGSH
jgi:hypothetical protein